MAFYFFNKLVFDYSHRIVFPDVNLASEEGLLAKGGELTPEVLLSAYTQGIFPWFNPGDPILWWSPDPRMVLYLDDFKVSKSLKQTIHSTKFVCQIDCNFESVIRHCAEVSRPGQDGTWITEEMIEAYTRLYEMGYVHSFETHREGRLVGGLYGVSMFPFFFGESMFHLETDASKVALHYLVETLKTRGYQFIDVQQSTNHLRSLGAQEITRKNFIQALEHGFQQKPMINPGI